MTTFLDHPVADTEAAVWALVKDLGGMRVWEYDSGGAGWVTTHALQVEARATSKTAARARAYEARGVVLAQAGTSWDDAVVVDVDVVMGPAWVPDDNGAPRYVARYLFTIHPRP